MYTTYINVGMKKLYLLSSINPRSAGVPISCGYYYDGVLKENAVEQEKYRNTSFFFKLP